MKAVVLWFGLTLKDSHDDKDLGGDDGDYIGNGDGHDDDSGRQWTVWYA